MMRPYEAFMAMAGVGARKAASEESADPARYLRENGRGIAGNTAQSVLYGLMSTPRGAGPISLVGSGAGGFIDGLLFKPVVDGSAYLIGKGLGALTRSRASDKEAL